MAKRLGKEWKQLEESPDEGDRFFAETKNNDLEWVMRLMVDDEAASIYAGLCSVVKLTFPAEYPFKAPIIVFEPAIYHPGIKQDTGEVCADLLKGWGPTRNVKWVMAVLHEMFLHPSTDASLEADIAALMTNDLPAFTAKVKAQIASMNE